MMVKITNYDAMETTLLNARMNLKEAIAEYQKHNFVPVSAVNELYLIDKIHSRVQLLKDSTEIILEENEISTLLFWSGEENRK